MNRQAIEKLVECWTEAIAAGRLDDFDAILAADVIDVTDARIDGMARRGEGAHLRVRGRRSFSPTRAALSGTAAAQ